MFHFLCSTSKLAGIIMLVYGSVLATVPEFISLNIIGALSYYIGAYQLCLVPISSDEEEVYTT